MLFFGVCFFLYFVKLSASKGLILLPVITVQFRYRSVFGGGELM